MYPGGAKEARAPRGFKAKTVKSAFFFFLVNFDLISSSHSVPRSTPVAWNPAYASDNCWDISIGPKFRILIIGLRLGLR